MCRSVSGRAVGVLVSLWLILPPSAAAGPDVGERVKVPAIDQCGEMLLAGESVRYRAWGAGGHPVLVNFMAARMGLSALNEPVVRALLRERPELLPHTVTLIDAEDAIWGTRGLVEGRVEARKRGEPGVRMVLDCKGDVGDGWGLPDGGVALLLIDADGTVRFVSEGPTPLARLEELRAAVDALDLPNAARDEASAR